MDRVTARDCNPGLEFSIPGFGIVEIPIPGSRRDWRSIVKTTKIATWVTVFGSLYLNYKCVRSCYGFSAAASCVVNRTVIYYYNYHSASADMASTVRGQIDL